jgi:hypothetical protein
VPKDNTLRPPRSGPSIGSERGCFTPSARYKDEGFLFCITVGDAILTLPHPERARSAQSKDAGC